METRVARRPLLLPEVPAIVAGHARSAILTPDGEILALGNAAAAARLQQLPPAAVVHAPATARRLAMRPAPMLDLLELFAFAMPARTATPTVRGLCLALDLDPPAPGVEEEVALLPRIAAVLLRRLADTADLPGGREAALIGQWMGRAGWLWAPFVLAAVGAPPPAAERGASPSAAERGAPPVWRSLPEWEEAPPPPPPAAHPVSEAEARARLALIVGPDAEQRPGQADFAGAAATAFAPREQRGDPHLLLAEAGTGTGKTLGYIAPAMVWAEKNRGTVWISTFTRHLQRQIDAELGRVFPDPARRRERVVLRKGRENYLCLLNLEEALGPAGPGGLGSGSPGRPTAAAIPLGLLLRWTRATRDGDLQGGDLPGWLVELFGREAVARLADRRGECIHAACPHWRRCFVEHTIRRARGADLVIANHALVMAQAVWGGLDDASVPSRYVFDEGHHLFDAADAAFSAVLSGRETAELRRWLLGAEGGRSRSRGLRRRVDELAAGRPAIETPLDAALLSARALPALGWSVRLAGDDPSPERPRDAPELGGLEAGRPNPTEAFLRLARKQVMARHPGADEPAGRAALEADLYPVAAALPASAQALERALGRIEQPLATFRDRLLARLEEDDPDLDSAARNRIEAIGRSVTRRALNPLRAWQAMLRAVSEPPPEPGRRPDYVQFLRLDRGEAGDRDVGLHRHWLDPTVPFAATLAQPAQGLLVTSATLRDAGEGDPETAWLSAEARVGAPHLPSPAIRVAVTSPFDYEAKTRAFVVTDVPTGNIGALAAAYRQLFLASAGGGLGLFTAIRRLQLVHAQIAPELEAAGIPLLSQHVDPMDNATLVDIFRTEEASCLLGTDAMRDGVDVPGRALRLVVFERVPWQRPDILHRERRIHLSGGDPKGYDDRAARLRLRQAFGRLIRREADRGVFVLLDRQTPSRLLSAFPPGVRVERVGLAAAVALTRSFLAERAAAAGGA